MIEPGVNIRELKAHLSKYLRKVKEGHTILITERGKPIGRIIPEQEQIEERLARMVAAGLAKWSGKKLQPRNPTFTNQSEILISDLVSEQRE
jgi:prevent-host-death family protein